MGMFGRHWNLGMFSSDCNFIHIGCRYNLLSITGIFHFNQSLGKKRIVRFHWWNHWMCSKYIWQLYLLTVRWRRNIQWRFTFPYGSAMLRKSASVYSSGIGRFLIRRTLPYTSWSIGKKLFSHVLWPPEKDNYIILEIHFEPCVKLFLDFTSSSLDICKITSVLVSFWDSAASSEVSVSVISTVLSWLDGNEHEGSFIFSSTCSWLSALSESESTLFQKQNQTSSVAFLISHQNTQAQ